MAPKDLLGRDMTPDEVALLEAYERLTALLERDLDPIALASVKEATAALWQAVNALALTDDRPDL
jgi:hypothetical protein